MPKSKYSIKGGAGDARGKANVIYVVSSTFGDGDLHEVSLILMNKATNNGFYEKHVLRVGDDSEDTLDLRRPINQQNVNRLGDALDRFGVINDANNTIVIRNAPASTMLRLDKIDLKLALYHIADAFLTAMYDNNFGDYRTAATSGNFDVKVTFPAQCVEQRDRDGGVEIGNTMTIGGSRMSRPSGDPVRVTFDVNHCNGI